MPLDPVAAPSACKIDTPTAIARRRTTTRAPPVMSVLRTVLRSLPLSLRVVGLRLRGKRNELPLAASLDRHRAHARSVVKYSGEP